MNLSDIIYEVGELGLQNARLDNDYRNFVNRAIKAIAMRRNWTFMHDRIQVTVPAGQTSVVLPATFKQLAVEKSPITYTDDATGRNIPVLVKTRAEIERQGYAIGYPYSRPLCQVFLELNASGTNPGLWVLNLPNADPNTQDVTFTISCFTLPVALVLGSDSNAMTNHGELADAIINKTKSIAYFSEDTTDKRGVEASRLYEVAYRTACYEDATQATGGQSIHM